METTYGYFSLELAAYDEYAAAMVQNPKLRDGLNVGWYVNPQERRIVRNPSSLPRAYFPKQIEVVSDRQASRDALLALDPAVKSVVLSPPMKIQQDPAATVSVVSHDEHGYRLDYTAASPSLLRVSAVWFPGWRATVDGTDCPVVPVDHALLGVIVPTGHHQLELRFHSNYFALGAAISLVSVAAALALAYRGAG